MSRPPSKIRTPTRHLTRTYIALEEPTKGARKYTVKIISNKGTKSSQSTSSDLKTAIKNARKKAGFR